MGLVVQQSKTDNQFLDSARGVSVFLEEKVSRGLQVYVVRSPAVMQKS